MKQVSNLAIIRKSKGITQKDISKILGVSVPTISRYERGARNIRIGTAKKLADVFDCTMDELFPEEQPEQEK